MKYCINGDEIVLSYEDVQDYLHLYDLDEIEAEPMRVDICAFYCSHFDEIGDRRDNNCGKSCEFYKPRNGKSGICKKWHYAYESYTDKVTIKRK